MAGQRVTHGTTTAGTVAVHLTGSWQYIRIINWGTVALQAIAQAGTPATPTLVWGADDQDVIPVGQSVLVPVSGAMYDQGDTGEQNTGVTAFVIASAATAGSNFTVMGANG